VTNVAVIVEGHGDALAIPRLVERIARERTTSLEAPRIGPPHRLRRHLMTKPEVLRKAVELQARRVGADGFILIVLDADEDCAVTLARRIAASARAARSDRRISVVVATHEYEAWLVAGARSLAGKHGLPRDCLPPKDPDALQNPKAWLSQRMADGYSETRDQAAFTMLMDLGEAESSRSFRKLVKEVVAQLSPP
jgi:hypothetical protein